MCNLGLSTTGVVVRIHRSLQPRLQKLEGRGGLVLCGLVRLCGKRWNTGAPGTWGKKPPPAVSEYKENDTKKQSAIPAHHVTAAADRQEIKVARVPRDVTADGAAAVQSPRAPVLHEAQGVPDHRGPVLGAERVDARVRVCAPGLEHGRRWREEKDTAVVNKHADRSVGYHIRGLLSYY